MSRIVGIDLGTTNSLVATVDSGIPLVIADSQRNRLTPSVVHISDSEIIVGHGANRLRAVKPAQTIYSVKRFIGRRGSDVSEQEKTVHYNLDSSSPGPVTVSVEGKRYSPEQISAEVLKKL